MDSPLLNVLLIGASLSEPHTLVKVSLDHHFMSINDKNELEKFL